MRMLDKSTKKKVDRMCKIAIRNAGMKQDDTARVLNVVQSVVSGALKEHRVTVLENERKQSTQGIATKALWYVVHYLTTT